MRMVLLSQCFFFFVLFFFQWQKTKELRVYLWFIPRWKLFRFITKISSIYSEWSGFDCYNRLAFFLGLDSQRELFLLDKSFIISPRMETSNLFLHPFLSSLLISLKKTHMCMTETVIRLLAIHAGNKSFSSLLLS